MSKQKIDFNVPFTNDQGEPVRQIKFEKEKTRFDPATGQFNRVPVLDEDDCALYENVMLKDMVANLVGAQYAGEEALSYDEKLKIGKLARKVGDSTKASAKNYTMAELQLIKDRCIKAGNSAVICQIDEAIEGVEAEAVETAQAAA